MICPGFWEGQCAAIRGAKARTGFPAPKDKSPSVEIAQRRVFLRNEVQSLGHREVKPRPARKPFATGISQRHADKLAVEVRAARKEMGMTVLQLAALCHTTPSIISYIENAIPVSDYSARKVANEVAGIIEARGLKAKLTTLIKSTEYN